MSITLYPGDHSMKPEKEKLKRYREIFKHSNDGIAIIDPRGCYIEQNEAHCLLLGFSDADLQGKTPAIHFGKKRFQDIFQALKKSGLYRGELTSRKKNGEQLTLDISAFTVKDDRGRVVCHVAIKRDISSRKQAEAVEAALRMSREKYQTVLESSPDPVVVYDMEGRAAYINTAFSKVFGWQSEDLLGKKIDFVPDENWPETHEMIGKVVAGERFSGYETRRYTKIGKIIDVSVSGATYTDHNGNPLGSIITLRDITEKKQLEAQLVQAQKMEAVGTLAGGIAHDFNNILQAISGNTQILMLDTDEESREYGSLLSIEKSVGRASDLTRQLLIFGRKVESELRPVNLNREVSQVSRVLKRTIPKMIAIELRLADALQFINADPVQLEQILMNLGVNARDAMADGGVLRFETENLSMDREACKTQRLPEPGEYVLLRVSDTGHGMDEACKHRIFEPFFTTKEVGKGTGLGLSMVYGSVQSHGGKILCTSAPGEGSTFDIYFPAIPPEKGRISGVLKNEKMPGGKETILLVDDESIILDVGTNMLERFGYRIITAKSGEQALDLFQEGNEDFDLVILDINMPGMGGNRCLKELLGRDPHLKVVIASGYASSGHAKEVIDAGAAGFVGKPYKLEEILGKVREILDK